VCSAADGRWVWGVVVLLTLLAGAGHGFVQSQRPLWLDEACTWWTIEAGPQAILRGERTDGSPPLYFLLVWSTAQLAGTTEWGLRFPSIVLGTLLVPATFLVARRLATVRAALLAALLTTLSPLVHYYATEARNYALLQFLALVVIGAFDWSVRAPQAARPWVVLALALAALLLTHNIAVFVLPVLIGLAVWLGGAHRGLIVRRTALVCAIAFLVYLPYFVQALDGAGRGVGDWIKPHWEETPPSLALVRSIEVFGFGGKYPKHLPSLAADPPLRPLGVVFSFGLLLLALVPRGDSGPEVQRSKRILTCFLFGPLLLTYAYSFLMSPLYLVGRYDTIALPAFLILLAMGIDKVWTARPHLGPALLLVLFVLLQSPYALLLDPAKPQSSLAVGTADYLIPRVRPDDVIIATEYRYAPTTYYLRRGGCTTPVYTFPEEVADHPGWYSRERFLRNPKQLEREAAELTQRLETAARRGARMWILGTPRNPVDEFLYAHLEKALPPDRSLSRPDLGLFGARLPEPRSK
jgi:4-amino-4-deoxy-L-arabinose transferase-like glycosyltransferase